jgi:DNA-binding IclR family transcriptional regulator
MANRSTKLGDDTGTALNQSDDVDDLQFVQSVGKAFRILRAFSTAQQLRGNQELAAATGLPRSTISRLSYTLTRLGYLNYVPDLMKYRLGDEALAFAGGILRGLDFRFAIRPYMSDLARHASANVACGIRQGLDMVYLEHTLADVPGAMHHAVGTRIPLIQNAMGRAYFVSISDQERAQLVAEWDAAPPPHWLEQRAAVLEQVGFYRQHGYVVSLGDWYADLNGCAVPVFSHRHGRWFYFNCGGHADIVKPDLIASDIAPRLISMCRTIENVLMGVETTPEAAPSGPTPPARNA